MFQIQPNFKPIDIAYLKNNLGFVNTFISAYMELNIAYYILNVLMKIYKLLLVKNTLWHPFQIKQYY